MRDNKLFLPQGLSILFALMILLPAYSLAQDLLSHIPKTSQVVFSFNMEEVNKKVDLQKMLELPAFDDLGRGLRMSNEEGRFDPVGNGISIKENAYFFLNNTADIQYFGFIFNISDANAFQAFLEKGRYRNAEMQSKDGYQMFQKKYGPNVAWSDKWGVFLEGTINYSNLRNYDTDWEDRENLKQQATIQQIDEIFHMQSLNSIRSDAKFLAMQKKSADISFFMNSENYMKFTEELRNTPMGNLINPINDLYRGQYSYASLFFEDGKIRIKNEAVVQGKMRNLALSANKARINKRFAKYIPEENLLGYMAFAVNSKNLFQGMKEIGVPILDSIPRASGLSSAIIDVLDIVIDEDALYDLLPGNAMLAVTGIKPMKVSYTTYEYDEDFNRTPVVKEKEEVLPEFTLMVSTKNEGAMNKILRAAGKIPESQFEKRGYYYALTSLTRQLGMNLYFAVADGMLFVTNNQDLVDNRLGTGYSSDKIIGKTHRKNLKKFNQVVFWDTEATLKALPREKLRLPRQGEEVLDLSITKFRTVEALGLKRKDPFSSEMQVIMANPAQNSLSFLFDYINEVYNITKKRQDEIREEMIEIEKN